VLKMREWRPRRGPLTVGRYAWTGFRTLLPDLSQIANVIVPAMPL
jgi:hypothetical protein